MDSVAGGTYGAMGSVAGVYVAVVGAQGCALERINFTIGQLHPLLNRNTRLSPSDESSSGRRGFVTVLLVTSA